MALQWYSSIDLQVRNFSSSHIDSLIRVDGKEWRFTGFYDHWDINKRMESWNLLRALGRQSLIPWLCSGDFNEILFQSEKKRGNRRADSLIFNFREALVDCDLFDCGFRGYPFTWANNHENGLIEEKIDRCFSNPGLESLFPRAMVHHGSATSSDHCPLVTQLEPKKVVGKKKKAFRFEAMWTREAGFEQLVRQLWQKGIGASATEKVTLSLHQCGVDLESWNRTTFGKIHVEILAS